MSINLELKNGNTFRILSELNIEKSNAEVTFSDLVLDFTDHTALDIPFKYQECFVVRDETILFTGFISEVSFSQMQMSEENRELNVTLLSPMAMATVRSATLVGTYTKEQAIRTALQPLLDDGFYLKDIDIPVGQITCNYLIQTIEFILNELSYKLGLFWYIDENKGIYIKQIANMFLEAPRVNLKGKIDNLLKLQPTVENIDYANQINIKRARLYYFAQSRRFLGEQGYEYTSTPYPILKLPLSVKQGDIITFEQPIVINNDRLKEIANKDIADYWGEEQSFYNFYIEFSDGTHCDYGIIKNPESNNLTMVQNGSWSLDQSNTDSDVMFVTDNFFKNLIVGFRYNNSTTKQITNIYSHNALRYVNLKFMNSEEIENMRGIISDTGIIEKTIDYNEKWSSESELIDYARSLLNQNTNVVNEIEIEIDKNLDLKIGDIVLINKPKFYINGKFVVTEISYTYQSDLEQNWIIKVKSADLLSSFIDLFRPETEQETSETVANVMIAEYTAEGINELHSEVV